MCKSMSFRADRKGGRKSGIQMHRLRYLREGMSDGCTGGSRRVSGLSKRKEEALQFCTAVPLLGILRDDPKTGKNVIS